jgi:hypothetical protein
MRGVGLWLGLLARAVPGAVANVDDTRENTCGDPDCPGPQAHAPDQTRPLPAWTPAERDAVLARTYGRH